MTKAVTKMRERRQSRWKRQGQRGDLPRRRNMLSLTSKEPENLLLLSRTEVVLVVVVGQTISRLPTASRLRDLPLLLLVPFSTLPRLQGRLPPSVLLVICLPDLLPCPNEALSRTGLPQS
jgi:hypothetical protein